tara:strand:+ start:423 stop:1001 length:579 start_codon:yes stop_codon:yes gene_type:complete
MTAAAIYVAKIWHDDFRMEQAGTAHPQALPGATSAPRSAYIIAILGSLVLLSLETWGEYRLDIVSEQSELTILLALYTLVAPIIEEIIFRGYLVINNRGATMRWIGIVAASAIFALLHPFLWEWNEGLNLTLTAKGFFSTSAAFVFSLWFYTVRFTRWNARHSLLPCFVAHGCKNLGVIAIKAVQGYVVGWW